MLDVVGGRDTSVRWRESSLQPQKRGLQCA